MKLTVSVRLNDELYQRVVEYAKKNDLNSSQVIRKALKEFLDKQKEQ